MRDDQMCIVISPGPVTVRIGPKITDKVVWYLLNGDIVENLLEEGQQDVVKIRSIVGYADSSFIWRTN